MRPTRWADVKRVFGEALDVPRDRREEFVAASATDPKVREQVRILLLARDRSTRFLEPPTGMRPAAESAAARTAAPPTGASESVGPDGRHHPRTTSAESPLPGTPPPLAAGAVLVERYELGERLGAGAFGAVHRAKDRVTGDQVAVKVLILRGEGDEDATRREVGMLYLARLPGLVEMLDEGIDQGHAFVVMRLVDGRPFPGDVPADERTGAVRWQDLAPRAIALCEALGRLHWLGILHRDLKPENVLVDAAGTVTIVDLGIARDADELGESSGGYVAGTLPYIAPERLSRATESVASDLYALGVILYELLAGRPPRAISSFGDLVRARAQPAPPLRDLAPDVPAHVAEAIDALVRADPALRPKSARLVAALLRGEGEDGARIRLPFVGSDAAVVAVLDAVKAKRPLDLCGPDGIGRTRTLQEADRRLTDEGYRVLWCRPGTKPFESLVPVVGEMPDDPDLTLDDLRAWLRRCLHFWLDVHVCVVADDWAGIDAYSREVLASVRSSGPLVRVFDGAPGAPGPAGPVPADALEVAPRTEEDLRDLFHGPDRIFHLREDGARELFRRTEGHPGDCVREIESWVDGGLAAPDADRFRLSRSALGRLAHGDDARRLVVPTDPADGDAARTLAFLAVAACPLSVDSVARATQIERWRLDAAVSDLVRSGLVRRLADARVEARAAPASTSRADPATHGMLADALDRPTQARLHHNHAAGRWAAAASDALALASGEFDDGHTDIALDLAMRGIWCVRRAGDAASPIERALRILILECALAAGNRSALETVIAVSLRSHRHRSDPEGVETLARAARLVLDGAPERALETSATSIPDDARAERARHIIRAFAARSLRDDRRRRRVVADAIRFARAADIADGVALAAEWLGWSNYRGRRYARAARWHAIAARKYVRPRPRISALLNESSAWMEAGVFDAATSAAERALRSADAARLTHLTARAEWLRRSIAYRTGGAAAIDRSLVDAARRLDIPALAGVLLLTEAAVAWRAGVLHDATELANAAESNFVRSSQAHSVLLCRALAAAASPRGLTPPPSPDELARCASPGIACQAAALSAMADPRRRAEYADAVESRRDLVAGQANDIRREVLSLAEAFLALKFNGRTGRFE